MVRCEVARNLMKRVVIPVEKKEAALGGAPDFVPVSKKWNREAYNVYMRAYMKAYRARKG